MAFIETQFPTQIGYGSERRQSWGVQRIDFPSGFRDKIRTNADTRRRYNAAKGVETIADVYALIVFCEAIGGPENEFRYKDWFDFKSGAPNAAIAFTDQNIGTGTGVLTTFQLRKTYTSGSNSYQRTIKKPVTGTVVVGVNGVQQMSGWSVSTTTGIVTFDVAPANGHAVTAGYEFDVPVEFEQDDLALSYDQFETGSLNVPMVEVLNP